MRILRHHRDIPDEAKHAVVALGNFDGVHRGHQQLIDTACRISARKGVPLAAVVFEPYPREFFQPDAEPFRLTPFRDKARLLAELDIDWLIVVEFNAEMATRSPQDFVIDILKQDLAADCIVVGRDFRFGRNRAGDATMLAYMGEMEGFDVTIVDPVEPADGAGKISSTRIRTALEEGRPEEAAQLLGHWWSVEGHVAKGDQRGRGLGFPTANISLDGYLHPAHGVYAVRAQMASSSEAVGEQKNPAAMYGGVASFGLRPMFALEKPLLEVHLFGFDGDLYGKILRVEFVRYLRSEQKFADEPALVTQMRADSEQAKMILAQVPSPPLGERVTER
jgi:riboflavin kinase/FMN adenylyltransferase